MSFRDFKDRLDGKIAIKPIELSVPKKVEVSEPLKSILKRKGRPPKNEETNEDL